VIETSWGWVCQKCSGGRRGGREDPVSEESLGDDAKSIVHSPKAAKGNFHNTYLLVREN